ncbi:cytochrome c biogenesis protein CcmF [Kordiimonas sediminis]|uniref:Cytochrome c biogenesis protein CcmF n=1 Tax=Kordiimonas sediminis TaxID=1735581 RepID=A0A919E4Z6_9PROT|nr:heme lyase CcmF/NrfE family subunit [Kordiimonas sediminis]GHF14391.1 cytochrome c biogenesis protein CcmF [Kordiimonas sediminis]
MIAEIGHFAVILALIASLIGATFPHVGIARNDDRLMILGGRMAYVQFVCMIVAFGALMYSYVISDFSVLNVATNSHSAKPLLYKIAGTWGNHEGSLLLWALMLSLFAAAVALRGKRLPLRFQSRAIAVQNLLGFGFLLFIVATSNPFERLDPVAIEGNGLNPLLQDPGLIFHPPMLYLGYVGLSAAFSFAVAALIEGEVSPAWARWVRPWTLAAWVLLTGGIALGSWWAYYELGWGGWWFWDPVENASFMPWLAATALLHSAIVVEKRDALKSWTILLAIIAFSLSLLGTFIVRSGVVVSVHAFASDPTRGIFILGFLAFVIGGSLALYAWRAPSLVPGGLFGMVSRESALVLNNILLSTFAGVVLVGTLYPLVLEAFDGSQISVGPPFFEFAAAVLMSPLVIALGFGPLLAWKRGNLSRAARILLPAFLAAVLGGIALTLSAGTGVVMTAFGFALALYLAVSVLLEIAGRIQLFKAPGKAFGRLRSLPRASWGMAFAHFGLAIVILGMTVSEAFTDETLTVLRPGEGAEVGDYVFTLKSVEGTTGPNYTAVRGTLDVTENGRLITVLTPEDRVYTNPVTNTTEASITPLFSGDLYAVIGESAGGGAWSMRLYFKPMISGLWVGSIMMMLGGLLSLSDRRLRIGSPEGRKKHASVKTAGGDQATKQPSSDTAAASAKVETPA